MPRPGKGRGRNGTTRATTPNSSGSGIWKTTDGGKTWKQINAGLPEARFRGRIGIDLCLAKPNILYAFVDNYEKAREATEAELADPYGIPSSGFIKGAHLYRSDDSGESWKLVCPTTPEMKTTMERHSGTYGWVFGQIRVDPNDENTVYTMGLGLNVSTDGGKTFRGLRGMQQRPARSLDRPRQFQLSGQRSTTAASSFPMIKAGRGGRTGTTFRSASSSTSITTWPRLSRSTARCRITAASGVLSI